MLSRLLDRLERRPLVCTMSLGRGTHFGIFKYAITVVTIHVPTDLIVSNRIATVG